MSLPDNIPGGMDAGLPFPRSYWVVPGRLLAGFLPSDPEPAGADAKLRALLDAGVGTAINLMEADERDHAGRRFTAYESPLRALAESRGVGVRCERHPIPDLGVPSPAEMVAILDAIDAGLPQGVVYVHCWGGRGRTGTVVGCWLARHGLATGGAVLELLAALTAARRREFPSIPETSRQRAFVTAWPRGK